MRSLLAGLIFFLWPVAASAQAIEDIAFYKRIVDKIEDGRRLVFAEQLISAGTVSIKQLPLRDKRRTVYAAATLTSEALPSKAGFVFQRIVRLGDKRCEQESDQILASQDDVKKLSLPTSGNERVADLELVRRKIADFVGGDEAEVKGFKLKIVTTEPGARTYYDFRYVSCPGQVRVWMADKELRIMAPVSNNPGIVLNIVE